MASPRPWPISRNITRTRAWQYASKLQGVRKIELLKVVATPDGSALPFYRMAVFDFDGMGHMKSMMETQMAKAMVADLANFATRGVTMLISEVS